MSKFLFASRPLLLFSFAIISFGVSMGEGLVFSCLLSRFIFVFLGNNDVSGLDYVKPSNDDSC